MDLQQLMSQLEARYLSKRYTAEWTYEREKLRASIDSFSNQFGSLYALTSALDLGGSGIALRAEFIPLNNEPQVIKFPRPVHDGEGEWNRALAKEADKLRTLRHQNIIRITFQGEVTGPGATQFYAMEYLEGVQDADVFLLKLADPGKVTPALVEIVRGSLEGLSFLHQNGFVHLDLKPANLFVDAQGHVVVADFGFAKKLTDTGLTTSIGGTKDYMHPHYADLMTSTVDDNRNTGPATERTSLKQVWDLYGLGQTYLRLLEVANRQDPRGRTDYERQYIRWMACRMLDGHEPSDSGHHGIPAKIPAATAYTRVEEALDNLHKLIGTHNLTARVPEISRYQKHTIQAASHGPVPFTERVERLIDAPEVRQLGKLPQLGLVHFIYPTATHSRLEHSLGTFAMVCRYVRSLYNDPFNPLFRQLVTDRDIEALLVAALVHDVGHYPLAHDLEEADEDVFSHERRTLSILRKTDTAIARAIGWSESAATDERWSVSLEDVAGVLDPARPEIKNQVLHSCIDGPIDADKLDYLLRDSENLRLPYGRGIDVEKLIQALTVIATSSTENPTVKIGIHEKGRIAAESLAFARYAMYGSVYWHHTHRAAKAMLNALAFEVLDQALTSQEDGYQRRLRDDLHAFVSGSEPAGTELPFAERGTRSAFLDQDSERMIEWLDLRGKRRAHNLAEALVERNLFKRALVVSQIHEGRHRWYLVTEIYGRAGRNWRSRRQVNHAVQDFVVTKLGDAWPPQLAKRDPMILVDFPPAKTGSAAGNGLDYLREEALKQGEGTGIEGLEESPVWGSLRDDSRNLAKLRVYCHPDLAGEVAKISRAEFVAAVFQAVAAANDR